MLRELEREIGIREMEICYKNDTSAGEVGLRGQKDVVVCAPVLCGKTGYYLK